jgi:TetR/AcrR family transcriptional regulator, mexJK operon transcriptional repressor
MESLRKSAAQAATDSNGPQPGVRKRSAKTREKIVRSAAKLFLERGYDSVSINEIIAVVGGSKETIYSNFGNKAKLFEAVVQQLCSDVTINIDTRPVGTLEEQATRMARSFVSMVLSPARHRIEDHSRDGAALCPASPRAAAWRGFLGQGAGA